MYLHPVHSLLKNKNYSNNMNNIVSRVFKKKILFILDFRFILYQLKVVIQVT